MILHFRPTSLIIAFSIFELVLAGYAYDADEDQQGRTPNVTKFQSSNLCLLRSKLDFEYIYKGYQYRQESNIHAGQPFLGLIASPRTNHNLSLRHGEGVALGS